MVYGYVSGGIASEATGGDFLVGAATGAIVSLANHWLHGGGSGEGKAKELALKYKNNENKIIAYSILSETSFELTENGGVLLTEARKKVIETYGTQNDKDASAVYSKVIDGIKEIKNNYGNKLTDKILYKISAIYASRALSLQLANTFLELRIKYLDLKTYYTIRPDKHPDYGKMSHFGGGGANGNWYY